MRTVSNTLFTGKVLLALTSVESTNRWMQQYVLQQPVVEGMVVVAEMQFAGKGQQGSKWESEPGKNLLLSVLFKPSFLDTGGMFYLNKAIASAVRATVQEFTAEMVRIKWPNDIYVGDKKIAGILIETALQGSKVKHCIVGVGLNVNQEKFSADLPHAISMFQLIGKTITLQEVMEVICIKMESYYLQLKAGNYNEIDSAYHHHLYKKDKQTEFTTHDESFFGVIKGVNKDGKLLVETSGELKQFDVKEISYR